MAQIDAPGRTTGYTGLESSPVLLRSAAMSHQAPDHIPRRNVATFFDLFEPERRAINQLLVGLRDETIKKDASVRGFNIGMNSGDAAGPNS
jgi:hypothetical protein